MVSLPGSGHVATLDVDAPLIFEQSVRFFLQHAAAAAVRGDQSSPPPDPGDPMTIPLDHTPFSSPFTGTGTRTGVVVSHGFTGSPHGVRDWAAVAGRCRLRRADAAAARARHQLAGTGQDPLAGLARGAGRRLP